MSAAIKSPSEVLIRINKLVMEIFQKHKQVNDKDEACGVLIGTHEIDGSKINICFATEPDFKDKRGRCFFRIISSKHNEILQNRFKNSDNREVYLGTWHTHPEDDPTPSRRDTDDWMKQYKANKHLFDIMVFVIVGRRAIRWYSIFDDSISELCENSIAYQCKEQS